MKFLISFSLSTFLTLTMVAHAQIGVSGPSVPPPINGPTLEETLEWITLKVNNYSIGKFGRVKIVFSGCEFKIFNMLITLVNSEPYWSGSLVDLDYQSAIIKDSSFSEKKTKMIQFYTMGREYLIEYNQKHVSDEYKSYIKKMENSTWVYAASLEDSESLANGFKHAIKMCQRQASIEKETRRKKDLF